MGSLFVRIYLGSLLFLAVALFIFIYSANTLLPSDKIFDNSEAIETSITQYLKDKPEDRWPHEMRYFNQILLDQKLFLVHLNDVGSEEKERLKQTPSGRITSDNKINEIYTLYQIPNSNWLLKIQDTSNLPNNSASINDWLDIILPLLLIFFTLAFGLFLLVKKFTNPILHLTQIANELGKGQLSVRADKNLPKPMNTLANGFNNMAERLQKTIQEQHILIGAIPHELRSPLGRIRFALDLTRDKKTLVEMREHIEKIDNYVDDMQTAVEEILQLNRLQNKTRVDNHNIKLCMLLAQLSMHYQQLNGGSKIQLECKLMNPIQGNSDLIKRAIQNLLENATRYAKSEVSIKAWQKGTLTIVQIDDDGAGIATDKLDKIFSPFATLDNSRNRKTGGIGLGLALVKMILIKHGGDVYACNNPRGGARFKLFW